MRDALLSKENLFGSYTVNLTESAATFMGGNCFVFSQFKKNVCLLMKNKGGAESFIVEFCKGQQQFFFEGSGGCEAATSCEFMKTEAKQSTNTSQREGQQSQETKQKKRVKKKFGKVTNEIINP